MSFWDWTITISIILGIILVCWAKASNQTVGELIRDLKDAFTGASEETVDVFSTYD